MEDVGELWPNTKIAETMVSLWAVSGNCVDWTGLDWMNSVLTGTVNARQKKMSSVGGDTHPPIAAPLSVLEGERAGGGRVTLGPVGLAVSQWPCKLEVWPSAPKGQDPPPTPWSAKYRYFAGQWRAAIRGLHIFGGMGLHGLQKSGHLSTGAMEGPFARERHQRDHSSPPSPPPSPTLTGEVYPSPTDLVETAPQRRVNSSPLVARAGVPDARVPSACRVPGTACPSPRLPMSASQRHRTSIPGP